MAYNKSFNPDALPAHAEPDQAAQYLSQSAQRNSQQKPPSRPNQDYGNHSGQHHPSQNQRPNANAYNQHQQQQQYRPNNLQTQYHYNQTQQDVRLQSPPPPAEYGHGPRPRPPVGGYTGQPPRQQYQQHQGPPPRSFDPPDADSADFYPLFRAANVSGTGALTTTELGSALVNADQTQFDPDTIRSLMRMFSGSQPNAPGGPVVTFVEFQNLWRFLAAWRELFERFDEDRSGKISLDEFSKALVAFGYRLSQPFVGLLYSTFNGRNHDRRGSRDAGQGMSFDLFVQACIRLKRMTDVFKTYDDDRDGYVTLSFEEFLSEILKLHD